MSKYFDHFNKVLKKSYSQVLIFTINVSLQTNGVTVKTENANDKNNEKSGENVGNVTIKQEPVDSSNSELTNGNIQHDIKTEIKQENMKPPPEKKPRL